MERMTGRFLMAMCGIGVVLVIMGWTAGWEAGGKGRAPATSGAIILGCWAVLQTWHTIRKTPPPPPAPPEEEDE